MVYNLSGLYYRFISICVLMFAISMILLLLWFLRWKKEGKRILYIAIAGIVGSLIFSFYLLDDIKNLKVEVYEGVFEEERRETHGTGFLPFNGRFTFSSEDSRKSFELDVFSKKKIFPDDFVEGKQYRIFYEKDSKIIVGVEELTE